MYTLYMHSSTTSSTIILQFDGFSGRTLAAADSFFCLNKRKSINYVTVPNTTHITVIIFICFALIIIVIVIIILIYFCSMKCTSKKSVRIVPAAIIAAAVVGRVSEHYAGQ